MAKNSSVLNVGRRRSRTDEKLDIYEARLLRRSKSHLDSVKAIRVKSKLFCQNRYRERIQGEFVEDNNELGQLRKSNSMDSLTYGGDAKGVDAEFNKMTDDLDEALNINDDEKQENTKSDTEPDEHSKNFRDIDQETTEDQGIKNALNQTCSDIASAGLSGVSTHLEEDNES